MSASDTTLFCSRCSNKDRCSCTTWTIIHDSLPIEISSTHSLSFLYNRILRECRELSLPLDEGWYRYPVTFFVWAFKEGWCTRRPLKRRILSEGFNPENCNFGNKRMIRQKARSAMTWENNKRGVRYASNATHARKR